jgi:hypothetical protein
MPGMTGIELAIQLNQERPDIKIIVDFWSCHWNVAAQQRLAVPTKAVHG